MTEQAYQIVPSKPDDEPVLFPYARCVYAGWAWMDEAMMRELEDGQ